MAALPNAEEWLANANEAITISLVAPSKSGLQNVATFNPKFTYSIFGEEEQIFGYKDLKINLRYRANDMRPHLKTSYSSKFKGVGDAEPTDIVGILKEGLHLPRIAFVKGSDFEDSSKQIGENWTPPGTLHSTIDAPDGQYEIWRGNLADAAVQQLNSRLQFFIPLFIEGGTYIGQDPESDSAELDLSDADRWTVFFLYKKQKAAGDPTKSTYTFVGYSTIFRFFYFQPPTPPASPKGEWELPTGDFDLAELPCRTRLSQFIILPPFQGKGVGARLYKTIFEHYHKHPQTHEFTVEDPNEAFDDLRDVCDLEFLRTIPQFDALHLDPSVTVLRTGPIPQLIVGGENLESIRLQAKIAPRQFSRVLEMHLMSKLPVSVRPSMALDENVPSPTKADRQQERLFQLVVKQRLYRHNKDILSQIETGERIEKLQQTLGGVELEYARILAAYERATKHSQPQPTAATNGKRKQEDELGEGSSKRARVEDA
ncbi:Histone acetyltransferase type B catalytic subunit [Neonectria ditissima]|uniref:Histone acetyltransferase type B catalytic subunit n=1 Tax=Neonectria ditissima TaxID=78410 RepID=A0A0P7BMY5_9HYPO|nr:Histone acetyltransferase type B catalytic subunit [Neonectria ditissima]